MNIFDHYRQRCRSCQGTKSSHCRSFLPSTGKIAVPMPMRQERLLMAIGEPVMVDTALEPRLSRLFSNRVIARYPAFEEFYGMEDAIEQIVSLPQSACRPGLEKKTDPLSAGAGGRW